MADKSSGAPDGAGSLWQTVGQAFETLRNQPVLAFSLAFGLLIVGGAGVLVTDGAGRLVAGLVLGALLLVYMSGLIAARGTVASDDTARGTAGSAETAGDSGAAERSGTPYRGGGLIVDIGNEATFSAENSLNRDEAKLTVGDSGKMTWKSSGNDPDEHAK